MRVFFMVAVIGAVVALLGLAAAGAVEPTLAMFLVVVLIAGLMVET